MCNQNEKSLEFKDIVVAKIKHVCIVHFFPAYLYDSCLSPQLLVERPQVSCVLPDLLAGILRTFEAFSRGDILWCYMRYSSNTRCLLSDNIETPPCLSVFVAHRGHDAGSAAVSRPT